MSVPIPSGPAGGARPIRSAFIVGAPRCGTTFLAKLLARHPNVCFSKPKESHFFVRDWKKVDPELWHDEVLRRYFGQLAPEHDLMIEGSPLQLRDPEAVQRLLRFDPETRFIVALRSPIDMIHSFHARLVYLLDEDERDFERAWARQAERARGKRIPRRCRDAASLQYRAMASLGTQLSRLYEQVDRDQVHVVLFDDVLADSARVYLELLEFLHLPDDGRRRFARRNENREFRHALLQTWLMNPPRWVIAWLEARQRKGKPRPLWVRELRRRIKRWNTVGETRTPLRPDLSTLLAGELAGEVALLERLLGRDLRHWLADDARTRSGRSPLPLSSG